jgi:hypothetical protein
MEKDFCYLETVSKIHKFTQAEEKIEGIEKAFHFNTVFKAYFVFKVPKDFYYFLLQFL